MDTKALRQKILDLAIHGKLVPQDPNDEPASVLLERIKAEKERLIKEGKIKRSKKSAKSSDTPHYENVPFEIPNNWVWTTVAEISKSILYGVNESAKICGAYKLLRITDIQEDNVDWDTVPFTNYDESKVGVYLLEENDILFARTGATVGKSYLVKGLCESSIYASYLIRVQTFKEILPQYVKYFFESGFYWEQIERGSVGIGQPNVNGTTLGNLRLPIPPINEQERIVSELKKWIAVITSIEANKNDLQGYIESAKSKILDLAIHGKLVPQDPNDEPAVDLLRRINPKFTPCDNGHSEKLPQSWCLSRLKELCSFLSRGKSPKYSDNDKTIPVFAQKCNLKEGGISLEQARFLDPSTICKWSEVYKLQTGDILVNSTGTGTVGRTRLFNESYLGQYPFVLPDSHISVVRAKTGIIPQYLYAYISSNKIQQYIEDNLAGSTNQKELYIGVLEQMEIFVPPLAEQQRIVQKIEELFSALDNIQNALEV
jgi:type I restriction enzyme S subunit